MKYTVPFAGWSALDIVMSIYVGSSRSRVVTGPAPLGARLAAIAVLVRLHLVPGVAVARSPLVS